MLALVLVILVFNFTNKSRVTAEVDVSNEAKNLIATCGDTVSDDLIVLEKIGLSLGTMWANEVEDTPEYRVLLARTAMTYSNASMVYLIDSDGTGINQDGEAVSVAETEFFNTYKDDSIVVKLFYSSEISDEGTMIGAFVPVSPLEGDKKYLILLYPESAYEVLVDKTAYGAWSFVALVDDDTNVIYTFGKETIDPNGNIIKLFDASNSGEMKKMKSNLANRITGMNLSTYNDKQYELVYTSLSANDWKLVAGINRSLIDKQVLAKWTGTKTMLYALVFTVAAFALVVVVINVVSKFRASERKKVLEEKADTDLLTGMINKLATERKIKDFIEKNPSAQSMMFLLDIDNFKKINDTMGHAFGDEVLRSLGKQIGINFRASDIVGRIGGDEFMVFLKNINDEETIRKEARKVEYFFKNFQAGEYVKYSATASIGVAIYPIEGADFESLYKAADAALYKAKKRGKNQLAFYDDKWSGKKEIPVDLSQRDDKSVEEKRY